MAGLTPEELLQIHKDYADEFASMAQAGLNSAFAALSNSGIYDYHPAWISITSPQIGEPKDLSNRLPEAPVPPELPELGVLKDFKDIPNDNLRDPPAPSFGSPPVYYAPPKPGTAPPFTLTPPTLPAMPVLPENPAFLALPDLYLPYPTVDIPVAPVLSEPVFEGRRPDDIAVVDPDTIITAYRDEQNAHRNMLPAFVMAQTDALVSQYAPEYPALRARINQMVIDYEGGTGIPANIEGAVLARATEKNAAEFQRALDTASATIAKLGFSMPPGALMSTLRQARMAMGSAQTAANTEIATKNFELEQKNFEFVFKLGAALEEKMLDTITKFCDVALKIDELSIQSAKEIVSAYLGAYNIQVLVYKAMWDGYQAEATVYRARIEAMLARVQVYEAEIKAELAKTEVNTAYVGILRAVADVNNAIAQQYKAQIEGAMAPIEYAKALTGLYEAQVRGFAAQTGVYESYWNAYKSEIEGELGKFRAYESQAQGYTAQVNGYRGQAEAFSARVNALAESNRAITSYNSAIIQQYSTEADVQIKNFEKLIAAYTAESNVVIAQAQIEVEYWRTKANLIMSEWNTSVQQTFEFAREQMNLFRGQMEAAINAGNGLAHAAGVAGALAGGAMTGLTSFAGNLVNSNQ